MVELNEIRHRTFATAAIFERRELVYGRRLKVVGYIGMVIPAIVGIIALGVGQGKPIPDWLNLVAAVLLGIQFVVSLFGTFMRWDEKVTQAARSQEANLTLHREADALFKKPPAAEFQEEATDQMLRQETELMRSDYRAGVTEGEKRFGERSALYILNRKCKACLKIPSSAPGKVDGDCPTCGQYKLLNW